MLCFTECESEVRQKESGSFSEGNVFKKCFYRCSFTCKHTHNGSWIWERGKESKWKKCHPFSTVMVQKKRLTKRRKGKICPKLNLTQNWPSVLCPVIKGDGGGVDQSTSTLSSVVLWLCSSLLVPHWISVYRREEKREGALEVSGE